MGTAAVVNLKHYHPNPAVVSHFIDMWKQRGLDLVAANIDECFLDLLRVVDPFQPALIVHAKDYCPAARVCQGNDFGCDLLSVDEPNLELDIGVFASPNQVKEISPVQRAAVAAIEFLLKQSPFAPRGPPARSELPAVCHCRSSLSDSGSLAAELEDRTLRGLSYRAGSQHDFSHTPDFCPANLCWSGPGANSTSFNNTIWQAA